MLLNSQLHIDYENISECLHHVKSMDIYPTPDFINHGLHDEENGYAKDKVYICSNVINGKDD